MSDTCRLQSRGNILLSPALVASTTLELHLARVDLTAGTTLLAPGDRLETVYFPLSAIVSVHERSGASDSIEVCLVGHEGMLGWSTLLGANRAAHSATVRLGGGALSVSAARFTQICASEPDLLAVLLRYVHVITVQMSRSAVSQRHDPVIRRVSRFLLMRHDRIVGDELSLLHEEIGACLDVRRATVTDVLHVLEGDRLIRCRRGWLQIRDRAALEAVAGDSYGVPEAHYREMIGPFGKGPAALGPAPASVEPPISRLATAVL